MKFSALILALVILPACGGFTLFKNSKLNSRKTASVETTVRTDDFESELKDLHLYYLLAQKNRSRPDDSRLIVIRAKIDEIESQLVKKNSRALKTAVSNFAQTSLATSITMKSISRKLGLKTRSSEDHNSHKSVEEAIKLAEHTKEFQIISMNIEHLSHMMNLKLKNTPPRKTSLDWMAQHPDKMIKRSKKLI